MRGIHRPEELLTAATASGMLALGWDDGGELGEGKLADFVSVDASGWPAGPEVASLVFASAGRDVTSVVIGGKTVVSK